ncbi:hypothetical protein IAR55_003723 [Kwoniella newhampshirensis]|uniref:Zn(2)-C6 fungal-type domain-containing protein n=1 Tax=Kwoniella newhampshirensis TaxID=1651941 RepID=A0AAW0YY45_9TREE
MPVTETTSGRARRSKKNRPCDYCRKQKHMCNIPARGPPCVGCEARNMACTYILPPTQRKRTPKDVHTEASVGGNDMIAAGTSSQGGSSTSDRPMAGEVDRSPGRAGTTTTHIVPSPGSPFNLRTTSEQRDDTNMNHDLTTLADLRPAVGGTLGELMEMSQSTGVSDPRTPPSTLPQPISMHTTTINTLSDMVASTSAMGNIQPPSLPPNPPYAPVEVHSPLDNDPAVNTAENETYFMGSHAVPALAVEDPSLSADAETLAGEYRQVSDNPRVPAFFSTKNPTLLYGRLPFTSQTAWSKVLERVGLMGAEDALRTCIVAHTTTYNQDMRPYHIELWSNVLQALEDEYRVPRLQTLQIALLIIGSRPNINSGQNSIAIARATGLAYLLGLHIDCTGWRLPLWERKVRLRVWWALVIHDSWHSLVHGRPSILSTRNDNVPLPTLDDSDWGELASDSDRRSMESFIAMCKMTVILKLRLLETIGRDLDAFDADLPSTLRFDPSTSVDSVVSTASGVRSMQLVRIGLTVVILRLTLGAEGPGLPLPERTETLLKAVLDLGELLATFLERLTTEEYDSYWLPYCPNLISEAIRLLLTAMFRISLAAHKHAWDIAMVAVRHLERLFSSVKTSFDEVKEWDRQVRTGEINDPVVLNEDTSLNFSPSIFDNIDLGSAFGAIEDFSTMQWLPENNDPHSVFPGSMF